MIPPVHLGAIGQGCGSLVNVTRTMIVEPIKYCRAWDAINENIRYRRMAATK
jgi:hypothetical protein